MGYNPQESLENTINTMGTRTLGVHPSLSLDKWSYFTLPITRFPGPTLKPKPSIDAHRETEAQGWNSFFRRGQSRHGGHQNRGWLGYVTDEINQL